MDNYPLVSILIPNYNKASYLRETLNSILAQTYIHWECVIVDDHSTDESWEILKEYSNYDTRIKIYSRPDSFPKGGNGSRNYALSVSSGSLILYLDSDDILAQDKISKQIIYNLRDPDLITISNWEFFGKEKSNQFLERYRLLNVSDDPIQLLIRLWNHQKFFLPFCFLIPRKLIKNEWKHYLVKSQDGDFFFHLLLNAKSVKFVENAYGYYRVPDSSHISRSVTLCAFRSELMTIISFEDILSINRNNDIVSGLVKNYVHFIIRSIDVFPVLANLASRRVILLDPNLKYINLYKRYFKFYKFFGFKISNWLRMSFIKVNRF